jgi:hypothetical protein
MHRCPDLASSDPSVGRLSFFGHSAGSIVVRAALASPLLRLFAPKLFAFVSLSSSHLGNMYMNSALIAGGMWAIKKLRKATLLEELQLMDAKDPTESYIYKLSKERGFEHFRCVAARVGSVAGSPLVAPRRRRPRSSRRARAWRPCVAAVAKWQRS